jgi:penicillin-binding protein 1A
MGYTSQLVAGLWVGYDQPRSLGSQESAGRLVAPVWADFMRRVLHEMPPETMPIPEGVFSAMVNRRTGLPTGPDDPEAITEYFIRGEAATPGQGPLTEPSTAPPTGPPPAPPFQPVAPLPAGASQQ